MNNTARYSNRRTISAWRTYRPPARRASTKCSREPTLTRSAARQRATTAAMPTEGHRVQHEHPAGSGGRDDDAAQRRSDSPGQVHVDPVERGRLWQHRTRHQIGLDRLPCGAGHRVAAAEEKGERQDERGGHRTEEGDGCQCRGGQEHADLGAEQQPPPVDQVGPGTGSASITMGRLDAVCTSDTSNGEWSTSSHCAPTVCIQVPTLEANCAIQRARKIGYHRIGAHADSGRGAGAVSGVDGRPALPPWPDPNSSAISVSPSAGQDISAQRNGGRTSRPPHSQWANLM